MRRPGDTQTPGPGGRVAARLHQYIEQRGGVTATRKKQAKRASSVRKPKLSRKK